MKDKLLEAVTRDDLNEVKGIIAEAKDSDVTTEALSESLISACENGHINMVAYLLTVKGVDVNCREKKKRICPLIVAIKERHMRVVQLLLKHHQIEVYAGDKERTNVLMHAARIANVEITGMVLDKIREVERGDASKVKEKVNKTDDRGYTALHWATSEEAQRSDRKGSALQVVRLLHKAGADINHKDNKRRTVLMRSSLFGFADIVQFLLKEDAIQYNEKDMYNNTALIYSKTDEIEQLFLSNYGVLQEKNDLDMTGYQEVKPNRAADHGNLERVKQFLADGESDINHQDHWLRTPLYLAVIKGGNIEVVKELLRQPKIGVNLKSIYLKTALMRAIEGNYDDIVHEILSKEGLDPNVQDNYGQTAVKRNKIEIANQMLNLQSIDLNQTDNAGRTALVHSFNKNHMQIVETLLLKNSVREHMDLTGPNREKSRDIIGKAGKRNNLIWTLFLGDSPERVLSLFVLMAAEIMNDRIEEQEDFWKYVLNQKEMLPYLKGDIHDKEGNTIFHYCAGVDSGKDGKNLLKLLPIAYFDNLHEKVNQNGDTMLHVAMKNKRLDIFHEIMDRFDQYSAYVCLWVDKILLAKNKAENTFLSIAIKSKEISDGKIKQMIIKIKGRKMDDVCKTFDRDENTLLHLATEECRSELITYLTTKQFDFRKKNFAGFTPLHTAAFQNDLPTMKVLFYGLQHRVIDINERTCEGETAMHIAAKLGSKEMIKQLVEFGGDLDVQDNVRNTPLHDTLQLIALEAGEKDADKIHTFREAWNAMISTCVEWWCRRMVQAVPDKDSETYSNIRLEAMYYLRSAIPNKDSFTVLEYAATLGLPQCVGIMLTEKDVFVKRRKEVKVPKQDECGCADEEDSGRKYEIEISNLIPEYFYHPTDAKRSEKIDKENSTKPKEGSVVAERIALLPKEGSNKDKKIPEAQVFTFNKEYKSKTFLEVLSKVEPPSKVSRELESFPMEKLARQQWYVYQTFCIMYLMCYVSVLIWYTFECQKSVRDQVRTQPQSRIVTSDTVMMALVVSAVILVFLNHLYYKISERHINHKFSLAKTKKYRDYVYAKGAVLNSVTYVVAFLADHLIKIILLVFGVGIILLHVLMGHVDNFSMEYYAWLKGIVIFCGWMIVIVIGRIYSPIYNFVTILKYIFLKDMVPFLLFYVILTVAFGCAIQLQFQLLSEETIEEHSSTWLVTFITSAPHVIWELFIITAGMEADMSNVQSIGYMFRVENYSTFYIELLLVLYGLASIVILLNMLIAAMSETYTNVSAKQGKGWRQLQVKVAMHGRRLTFDKLDALVRWKSGARQDEGTGRWYLPISDRNLKEIKATYWRTASKEAAENATDKVNDMENKLDSLLKSVENLKQKEEEREKKLESLIALTERLISMQSDETDY